MYSAGIGNVAVNPKTNDKYVYHTYHTSSGSTLCMVSGNSEEIVADRVAHLSSQLLTSENSSIVSVFGVCKES